MTSRVETFMGDRDYTYDPSPVWFWDIHYLVHLDEHLDDLRIELPRLRPVNSPCPERCMPALVVRGARFSRCLPEPSGPLPNVRGLDGVDLNAELWTPEHGVFWRHAGPFFSGAGEVVRRPPGSLNDALIFHHCEARGFIELSRPPSEPASFRICIDGILRPKLPLKVRQLDQAVSDAQEESGRGMR